MVKLTSDSLFGNQLLEEIRDKFAYIDFDTLFRRSDCFLTMPEDPSG